MPAARGQQRSGGVTGVHIWLIVFVALWLTSTVLLVWLYTDQAGLQKRADDAVADNRRIQGEMREASDSTARITELAVGADDADEATVGAGVDDLYTRIRGDEIVPDVSAFDDPTAGLLVGMNDLYQAYQGEHDARVAAEDRSADLAAEVDRLNTEKAENDRTVAERMDSLAAQVRDVEAAHDEYRQQRDEEIDGVESRIGAIEQENSRDIQQQRTLNETLAQERDVYKSRYDDLQTKIGELQIKPSALITARQGDGMVLTAKYGEDVVYINLGRRHQITLGMQFAVYSGDQEIPADGMAKARVEVARIFDSSSECVIREMFGRAMIVEGDVINNPIYERDKSLTFVVVGGFDLDGDGMNDRDGTAATEALIRNWGGKIAETVTARVDFVVVGAPPSRPSALESTSPEAAERQAAVREAFETYVGTVEAAQALSVPILTQEVFLRFLGFSGTGSAVALGR